MRCSTCGAPDPGRVCRFCRTSTVTERAALYSDKSRAGWLSPNEARRAEGQPRRGRGCDDSDGPIIQ